MSELVYIAVRKERGEEWVDLSSTAYEREACSRQAKEPGGRAGVTHTTASLAKGGDAI